MSHIFPELPYAYDSLEPYIDAKTMEVHYSKHHRTYFDKFISAVEGTELASLSLKDLRKYLIQLPKLPPTFRRRSAQNNMARMITNFQILIP